MIITFYQNFEQLALFINYTYKACFLDFTMIALFAVTYKAPYLLIVVVYN